MLTFKTTSFHYLSPQDSVDVTPIPLDVGRILYVYRNVIRAITRTNQSFLFRKTYACMENPFPDFLKQRLISELFNNINAHKASRPTIKKLPKCSNSVHLKF